MEELRQREANLTALQAIGPRKKPKLDVGGSAGGAGSGTGLNSSTSGMNRQMQMRPRLKRVNYRDLLFLLEQEKETCRSTTLYKSYLKWCCARGRNNSDPPYTRRPNCMVLRELASLDLDHRGVIAYLAVFHKTCTMKLTIGRSGISYTFRVTLFVPCRW